MNSSEGELRGGIDLGGTKIQTAIVDTAGKVRGESRRQTPTNGGPKDVAAEMAIALERGGRRQAKVDPAASPVSESAPREMSMRRPGPSRRRATYRAGKAAFRSLRRSPRTSATEVRLGNDVQVATEAEFRLGAGREFQSLIGVFWGTGVGGGLILDGRPWIGRGAAGEIGHMVDQAGRGQMPLRAERLP